MVYTKICQRCKVLTFECRPILGGGGGHRFLKKSFIIYPLTAGAAYIRVFIFY